MLVKIAGEWMDPSEVVNLWVEDAEVRIRFKGWDEHLVLVDGDPEKLDEYASLLNGRKEY